jgi:hypothetical protein
VRLRLDRAGRAALRHRRRPIRELVHLSFTPRGGAPVELRRELALGRPGRRG